MAVNGAPLSPAALLAALGFEVPDIVVVPLAPASGSQQIFSVDGYLIGFSIRDNAATANTAQEVAATTAVGAAISAVLADTAGQQTFITGFDVTLGTPAAAAQATITITGIAQTLTYQLADQAVIGGVLSIRFAQPIPGLAITVALGAVGGGAAANSVIAFGDTTADSGTVFELYSGSDTKGIKLASMALAAGTDRTFEFSHDIPFVGGLFLNKVSGSFTGALWVRPATA
jgi:hypothetical protein